MRRVRRGKFNLFTNVRKPSGAQVQHIAFATLCCKAIREKQLEAFASIVHQLSVTRVEWFSIGKYLPPSPKDVIQDKWQREASLHHDGPRRRRRREAA